MYTMYSNHLLKFSKATQLHIHDMSVSVVFFFTLCGSFYFLSHCFSLFLSFAVPCVLFFHFFLLVRSLYTLLVAIAGWYFNFNYFPCRK